MTKLKIKEKTNWNGEDELNSEDCEHLGVGDVIYSYNWDKLIMVVKSETDDYLLINLEEGEVIEAEDGEYFKQYVTRYVDQFGPFFRVSKAKITFKVGE